MYAVVDVSGKQFKMAENDVLDVPALAQKEGETVELKNVLVYSKDGTVEIGTPHVAKASVTARVLGMVKGKKVISFKMKRRKGFHKKQGHRQQYTRIQVEKINK